jgi:16S rRNA (guanine(1405)-N(7))-methyltransferase
MVSLPTMAAPDVAATVDRAVDRIARAPKYGAIHRDTIRRIVTEQAVHSRSYRDLEQRARRVLHRATAHYLAGTRPADLLRHLAREPPATDDEVRSWCAAALRAHRSTAERIAHLDEFYPAILDATCRDPRSIGDLACGLNPLTLPWLRSATSATYVAVDFNLDYVRLARAVVGGRYDGCEVRHAEVLVAPEAIRVDVALLLKTYHCIEARCRGAARHVVDAVAADYVVVSFPSRALNGRAVPFVDAHLADLTELAERRSWSLRRVALPTEDIVVVVKRER